jgi:hypothetical protein
MSGCEIVMIPVYCLLTGKNVSVFEGCQLSKSWQPLKKYKFWFIVYLL